MAAVNETATSPVHWSYVFGWKGVRWGGGRIKGMYNVSDGNIFPFQILHFLLFAKETFTDINCDKGRAKGRSLAWV